MVPITEATVAVEIVPQVGDFISPGDDLFRLGGPGADAVGESELRQCVWFGPERTLEQDPAFGFRVIWCNRFGPIFAAEICRKRVNRMRSLPRWRWHLNEVFV